LDGRIVDLVEIVLLMAFLTCSAMFSQGLIDKPVKMQRLFGCAAPGSKPKGTSKKSFVFSKLNAVSADLNS